MWQQREGMDKGSEKRCAAASSPLTKGGAKAQSVRELSQSLTGQRDPAAQAGSAPVTAEPSPAGPFALEGQMEINTSGSRVGSILFVIVKPTKGICVLEVEARH